MRHEDVRIDRINVGDRYRKDDGDLEALAANIRQMGLLQPIGLNRYYQLIFGSRRLQACTDILEWETIPCVILDMESLLAGEYAENEFRKEFTASERAAIGEAIQREIAAKERRGGDQKSKGAIAPNDESKGDRGRTVDLAAKRAGFQSRETFERAKTVLAKGSRELITAMDSEELSISAAAAIAHQPKADQTAILNMPQDQQREVLRRIRKQKADREADERRARDLRLFSGLHNAVEFIATFYETPEETWRGLARIYADTFSANLRRAIECLVRLDKEHPNEPKRPRIVTEKTIQRS